MLGFPRPAARGFTTVTATSLPTEGGKQLSTLTLSFRDWSIASQSKLTLTRQYQSEGCYLKVNHVSLNIAYSDDYVELKVESF